MFLRSGSSSQLRGFSFIEVLVVSTIVIAMMGLASTAYHSVVTNSGVDTAVHRISAELESARSYAITHNTYTWVGFQEESVSGISQSSQEPPYPGKGRVLIAVIASRDGTELVQRDDPAGLLPIDRFSQIGKTVKLENVHLTDLPAPLGGMTGTFNGRPSYPCDTGNEAARISSDSAARSPFPFEVQGCTFYKTVRFSPRGEAVVNNSAEPEHYAEIGIRQTRGSQILVSSNVAAIQFTGIAGNVKIYKP